MRRIGETLAAAALVVTASGLAGCGEASASREDGKPGAAASAGAARCAVRGALAPGAPEGYDVWYLGRRMGMPGTAIEAGVHGTVICTPGVTPAEFVGDVSVAVDFSRDAAQLPANIGSLCLPVSRDGVLDYPSEVVGVVCPVTVRA